MTKPKPLERFFNKNTIILALCGPILFFGGYIWEQHKRNDKLCYVASLYRAGLYNFLPQDDSTFKKYLEECGCDTSVVERARLELIESKKEYNKEQENGR